MFQKKFPYGPLYVFPEEVGNVFAFGIMKIISVRYQIVQKRTDCLFDAYIDEDSIFWPKICTEKSLSGVQRTINVRESFRARLSKSFYINLNQIFFYICGCFKTFLIRHVCSNKQVQIVSSLDCIASSTRARHARIYNAVTASCS